MAKVTVLDPSLADKPWNTNFDGTIRMDTRVLPKPFEFTNPGFTTISEEFLQFAESHGEKICNLPDSRQLAYFTDGDPSGIPMFCFHGGCEGKYKFAQKTPVPGIFMVSIDRPHHGGSSPIGFDYTFEDAAKDITALAESLGFADFVLAGHSIGSSWCMQLACIMPNRVRGIILFGAMMDSQHDLRKKYEKGQQFAPACCDPAGGCCGCVLRSAFGGPLKAVRGHDYKSIGLEEHKPTHGGDPGGGWESFEKDDFWITSVAFSMRSWYATASIEGDAHRTLIGKW
jgi:pimeloyl-ACP methyl ester carboxylesterase